MLSLALLYADIGEKVVKIGDIFIVGTSHVDVFKSAHITSATMIIETGTSTIWAGETTPDFLHCNMNLQTTSDFASKCTGCEGIMVTLDARDPSTKSVCLSRTACGSSPIYLSTSKEQLFVSWKFEEAAAHSRRPNVEACHRYLEHGPTYTSEQIIEGVYMLWPGEKAHISPSNIKIAHAEGRKVSAPGTMRDDAVTTRRFLDLIAEDLAPFLSNSRNTLIELSGGYDSTCVAIAAAAFGKPLNSYGLIHEGAMGKQQSRRRSEAVRLLKLHDFEYPSFTPSPLAALELPECQVTPFDDNHRMPCAQASELHPNGLPDLIVTGVGGDELTLDGKQLQLDFELRGGLPSSTIVTSVARSDMFMRRGIWVKNPLAARQIFDFCRALPRQLKRNRLINILTMARAGFSDGFIFPRYLEHYGSSMQHEAALIDYDNFFHECAIADHGISTIDDFLYRVREAMYGGFSYQLVNEAWRYMKLEVLLRKYI